MLVTLNLSMPEGVFSSIRKSPVEFGDELLLAAAVKWFEMGMISQEKAAGIAGLTRVDFVLSLTRFKVSPFQYSPDEVLNDLKNNHVIPNVGEESCLSFI